LIGEPAVPTRRCARHTHDQRIERHGDLVRIEPLVIERPAGASNG
jgi:hypothetical protein